MRVTGATTVLILLVLGAPAPPASAHLSRLLPVDEASRDPSFLAFRIRLLDAIRRRDARFLMSVVAKDIRISFGLPNGIDDFRKEWQPDSPRSRVWPEGIDSFEHFAIVGADVRVRARPSRTAPVISTLSYAIVRRMPDGEVEREGAVWRAILGPGGGRGYVDARYARSPIDYRACFEREAGRWMMTIFVAGD